MPRYEPIEIGVRFQASLSNLIAFDWRKDAVSAAFIIPSEPDSLLRVTFNRECIVRLLDEMPLSTEDEASESDGLIPEHFAYRVTGSAFELAQSKAWKVVQSPAWHYRFITGWGCMDVLSAAEPSFERVGRQPI